MDFPVGIGFFLRCIQPPIFLHLVVSPLDFVPRRLLTIFLAPMTVCGRRRHFSILRRRSIEHPKDCVSMPAPKITEENCRVIVVLRGQGELFFS